MTTQTAPALWQLEWTFGDRLRKLRRVLGLTTAEPGETLGVTGQAVSNLEGRTNTPRQAFEIASQLEREYGVPAWWVLGHENAPDPEGPGASWRAREDSNPQPSDLWSTETPDAEILPFPTLIDEPTEEREAA